MVSGAHFVQEKTYRVKFVSFKKQKNQADNDCLGLYKQRQRVKAVLFLGQILELILSKKENHTLLSPRKAVSSHKPGPPEQWALACLSFGISNYLLSLFQSRVLSPHLLTCLSLGNSSSDRMYQILFQSHQYFLFILRILIKSQVTFSAQTTLRT